MTVPVNPNGLTLKLIEFLTKLNFLPGLVKPFQIKRVAKAEAEAQRTKKLLSAMTKKEIEAINNGTHTLNEKLELIPISGYEHINFETKNFHELFIKEMNESAILDKIKEITNVSIAINHAEQILQQDSTTPSDEELNVDWFNRWKQIVGNVGDSDMQLLWGKILADAIKSPKTTSLRTLSFFQDLNHETAKLVNRLAPFIMDTRAIAANFVKKHFKLEELMLLEEIGIIHASNPPLLLHKNFELLHNSYICVFNFKKTLLIARSSESQLISPECLYLTSLGQDVMRFITFNSLSHDTAIKLSESIFSNRYQVSYTNSFDEVNNGQLAWDLANEIIIP